MWKDQAKTCINNGFNLIALRHKDKRPLQAGKWEKQLLSHTSIDNLPLCGFGMVCGIGKHPIYAFDVDSKDAKTSETFMEGFELNYGTPHIRIGQKPKFLIPFRMKQTGIKKKKTPDSQQGHLDILGDGQYFVAYNIHPVTKEEYTWSKPPHEFKAEELPLLSEKDVEYLFELFTEQTTPIIKQKTKKPVKEWNNVGNRQYTNREITAFLSCFNEEFYNGTHDEWIPIVMAVHHETRGSNKGKEIARRWSKQGSTYNEENFNYKWDTFDFEEIGDKDKKRSTFASLFYHHKNLIPNGLLADRFCDSYNKALFSICKRGQFLYTADTKEWYKKDKNNRYIWKITNDKIAGYVMEFLTSIAEDAFDICEEYEDDKGNKKKSRELFFKAYNKRNVTEQSRAKSTANAIESKSLFNITSDKLDNSLRYIGEKDGITDLETGQKIIPKEELYITKSTNTPFVEGKPSKEFIKLVSTYFEHEEVMHFFARIVGMALYGGNEAQKIVNLLGVGNSGKSTLIKLLQHAFGDDYIAHLQFTDIMSAFEGDSGGPSPSIINAFGSRIAVINETNEHAPLNEAIVKAITGGDTLASRLLYSNAMIRKKASFTPFITTNKFPLIRSIDNSIWRRIVVIPFNREIANVDPTVERKLPTYALEAKKWFLQGLRDYLQRGHDLAIPEICLKAVDACRTDLDTYKTWIEECCEIGNEYYEEIAVLTESYNNYLKTEEKSRHSVQSRTFSRNLKTKGFEQDSKCTKTDNQWKTKRVIKGLKLRSTFESIDEEPSNVLPFPKS
ncbi:MAG: DNA primase [Candidatus Liberibacter europaeus]|uniref:DNA primase n=1 Tax=Candidatus Liberibacter europaeus TaxID=744859 RepID=A0A2T4VWN8_9HYPH|nr:DNA primase [Candidatus Liberibacter europaeus]PTL86193.1 MAG: DNA primase [Candidatus Liberibacter europaeus]